MRTLAWGAVHRTRHRAYCKAQQSKKMVVEADPVKFEDMGFQASQQANAMFIQLLSEYR